MARIPSVESVTGPASLRPTAPAPVADYSGIARGAINLTDSVNSIIKVERERQNTIDFAAADAYMTRNFLDMQNQFEQDGDYATIAERAERGSQQVMSGAAQLIRDPRARQQWVAASESTRIKQTDALGDIGRAKANEAERVQFLSSLEDYSRIITEPGTPADVRDRARLSLSGTIDVARQNGLLTPAEADKAVKTYIDGAEEQLALNEADRLIRTDPEAAARGLGIETAPDDPLNSARTSIRIPVVAAPGVDLANVDPATLTRFEQVQEAFGVQLPIISGVRDKAHNDNVGGASQSQHMPDNGGTAIDVDVSSLSKPERLRLIQTASAMGMTGIGVYADSLHFDTRQGRRAAWGPSFHNDSIPAWARDVMDQHTGGKIAQVPVGAARGVDDRFAALSYQQRAQLFDRAKAEVDKADMNMRAAVEVSAENAPYAIAATGQYDGFQPTANDFVRAYGARDGMQKYEAFDASVKVAENTFAMRTMSNDEILALVEGAVPDSSGDDAALQAESFAQLSGAADQTLKARAADPAGYVQQTFPAVQEAWAALDNNDPASFENAVTVTAMAQQQLGFQEMTLLPKTMATNTAAAFNNVELSDQERIGALTSVVLATQNQEHQGAILNQLVDAGVPETIRPAMDALARGDAGAASRLMQAAMASPEVLGRSLPGDIKSAQVEQTIDDKIFDVGQIGDVAFDLTYGSNSNLEQAANARTLMTNSVKLRMLDGSAGGDLQRAIDLTVKDMFGDIKIVTGSSSGGGAGLKVTLPSDADEELYRNGFNALMGTVGEALAADLKRDGQVGEASTANGQRAILEAGVANYVQQALDSGYFANAGDGVFKFIDPNSGTAITDETGAPLLFSRQDVLAAGADATGGAVQAGSNFGAGLIRP